MTKASTLVVSLVPVLAMGATDGYAGRSVTACVFPLILGVLLVWAVATLGSAFAQVRMEFLSDSTTADDPKSTKASRIRTCIASPTMLFSAIGLEASTSKSELALEDLGIVEAGFRDLIQVSRTIAVVAVLVGLFGTLVGLILATESLRSLSDTANSREALDQLAQGARHMLQGFGSAFYAAASGAVCAILLSVTNNVYDWSVSRLMREFQLMLLSKHAESRRREEASAAERMEAERKLQLEAWSGAAGRVQQATESFEAQMRELASELQSTLAGMKSASKKSFDGLTKASDAVENSISELKRSMSGISSHITEIQSLTGSIQGLAARIDSQAASLSSVSDAASSMRSSVDRLEHSLAQTSKDISDSVKENGNANRGLLEEVKGSLDAASRLVDSVIEMVNDIPLGVAAGRLLVHDVERVAQLETMLSSVRTQLEEYREELRAQGEKLDGHGRKVEEQGKKIDDFTKSRVFTVRLPRPRGR